MRPFGVLHFSILAAILAVAIVLARLSRSGTIDPRRLRYALAAFLALNELIRYLHDGFQFPNNLPIHLCTLTTWMAVAACLTLSGPLVEFVYFTGIAGAGMALLTPDLPADVLAAWPSYAGVRYYVEHGAIVVAVAVLVFGGMAPLKSGAVWRAALQVNGYMALLGLFNWYFGTNYMFLCRKPRNPSLLDFMGPWPYYLLAGEVVGLALCWLLYWPARPAARHSSRRAASGLARNNL
jgi:hypothetical integral membrane protein (TIGR02206 family)